MTAQVPAVSIIGAGAWGCALALSHARVGRAVTLWARDPAVIAEITTVGTNVRRLPGIAFDPRVSATADLSAGLAADTILLATPAQQARSMARLLAPLLTSRHTLVNCAKGLEQATGRLVAEVLTEELPRARIATLSGPGFAADLARGLPAALTLGCRDEAVGLALAERLSNPGLRLYWTSDVRGVELGGAVKNVLAIAAGILDGKGLGGSAHAALVTRGFAELRRLADALGARPETLQGLSGLGDLILTCGSTRSRNFSLGQALGRGEALPAILAGRSAVTEGVYTAAAVARLSQTHAVDMPISGAVHAILEGHITVDAAIASLLARPIKAED
ncbi:MAG: NAD(P)-dependent glycerol-3-phosphate dehydrogenase [Hyphomicrobiaceae bacterium]|nr:NAD(P)-dependent glycerol-3-phosphate dehydrogenase [Hyphomicrobiaceae bacterium]